MVSCHWPTQAYCATQWNGRYFSFIEIQAGLFFPKTRPYGHTCMSHHMDHKMDKVICCNHIIKTTCWAVIHPNVVPGDGREWSCTACRCRHGLGSSPCPSCWQSASPCEPYRSCTAPAVSSERKTWYWWFVLISKYTYLYLYTCVDTNIYPECIQTS